MDFPFYKDVFEEDATGSSEVNLSAKSLDF